MAKEYYRVDVDIQFENNTQANVKADDYDYMNDKYMRFAKHFKIPCEGIKQQITAVVNLDHVNMITFNHAEEEATEW